MGPSGYYGLPAQPRRTVPRRTLLLGAGIIAVILAITLLIVSANAHNADTDNLARLSLRLASLSSLTSTEGSSVGSDSLQKANAEVAITSLAVTADLGTSLPLKVSDSIKKAEADTSAADSLTQAKQAGNFDSVYSGILTQKIESIMALANELEGSSKNTTLVAILKSDTDSLTSLSTELAKN